MKDTYTLIRVCVLKKVTDLSINKLSINTRPQAKCPPTCEMSVCGEYVYNMYVKNMPSNG